MQIDWFTLLAQVVNFLVLVWLLKRFLYGRIVRAMDEREATISASLESAAKERAAAEQEAAKLRASQQDLDERREQLLLQARKEADAARQNLIDDARNDAENMQAQWFESMQQEKSEFLREFREKMGQQFFTVVRRALKELANVELEQQMAETFLRRIEQMEPAEREVMVEAIRATGREVELRSAFTLAPDLREKILKALRDRLDDGLVVRFEIEPALGFGFELCAHSRRLAWNLISYLESLEGALVQALERKAMDHEQPRRERSPAR